MEGDGVSLCQMVATKRERQLGPLSQFEAEAPARLAALDEIGTTDRLSLERFQTDLISAGFEPVEKGLRKWRGPILAPFRELTEAPAMDLVFQDGWPFRPPKLFVEGLLNEHVNAKGEVCLWQAGDNSLEWTSLAGLEHRVEEWCRRVCGGFGPEDAALDAHLYFQNNTDKSLAVFDLTEFKAPFVNGDFGRLYASRMRDGGVALSPSEQTGPMEGRWYYRSSLPLPPRDLQTFRLSLTDTQQRNFDRFVKESPLRDDSECLAVLIWNRVGGTDVLVVKITRDKGELTASALVAAPNDERTLKLRAGPDAQVLAAKHVALFGAGAIGSHLALALSKSGVGSIKLIDDDVLHPSNVVRHVANSTAVGRNKAEALAPLIELSAPWTAVHVDKTSSWHPHRLAKLLEGCDLAIETTGLSPFTEHLSIVAEQNCCNLVSVALYRGGAVLRVRRQLVGKDVSIHSRMADGRYVVIPPGKDEEEVAGLEPGCSSPVNNASPVAVETAACLAASVAIDALAQRYLYDEEIIEILRPLDSPFDKLGYLSGRVDET
jgi:hypothetical protein